MIDFSCDVCGTPLQALDQNAGKKARCQCGSIMRVPAISSHYSAHPATYEAPEDYNAREEVPAGPVVSRPFDDFEAHQKQVVSNERYDDSAPMSRGGDRDLPSPDSLQPIPPTSDPSAPVEKPAAGADVSAIFWGVVIMVGSVVWFFGGLAAGRVFIYPAALFFIGLFKTIGGIAKN